MSTFELTSQIYPILCFCTHFFLQNVTDASFLTFELNSSIVTRQRDEAWMHFHSLGNGLFLYSI